MTKKEKEKKKKKKKKRGDERTKRDNSGLHVNIAVREGEVKRMFASETSNILLSGC